MKIIFEGYFTKEEIKTIINNKKEIIENLNLYYKDNDDTFPYDVSDYIGRTAHIIIEK